jgi:hypothetical protein
MNYFGHDYYKLQFIEDLDNQNMELYSICNSYLENVLSKQNKIPTKLKPYVSSTMLNEDFFGLGLSPIGSYQLDIFNNIDNLSFNIPHSVCLDNAGISEFIIFNIVLPKSVNMSIVEYQNNIKKEITLNQLQEYITDKQKFYLHDTCWDFLNNGSIELHLNFANSFYYENGVKTVSLSLTFFEKDILTAKLCMPNHENNYYDSLDEDTPYVRGYDRYKKMISIIETNFVNKEYIFI